MARSQMTESLSVEQLLNAVEHLSPAELGEFQRRLAARRMGNGEPVRNEAALLQASKARLPAPAQRRLKTLIARSECGSLTPKELADYQGLAQQAQRIDAARMEALAELAQLWGKSIPAVKAEIGWRGGPDEA